MTGGFQVTPILVVAGVVVGVTGYLASAELKDEAKELGRWWHWLEGVEYLNTGLAILLPFVGAFAIQSGQPLSGLFCIAMAVVNYGLAVISATNRREEAFNNEVKA